jgi:hypothetical protein
MRGRAALSTVLLVVLLAAVGLGDGAIDPDSSHLSARKRCSWLQSC